MGALRKAVPGELFERGEQVAKLHIVAIATERNVQRGAGVAHEHLLSVTHRFFLRTPFIV
jgi:hypothetical protein